VPLNALQLPCAARANGVRVATVLIDDLFVTAGSLVNGTTIDYADAQSEYFHIELPIHDAVYAAGLPCESYIARRTVMGLRNSRQHGVAFTQCGRAVVGYPPPS
jgi:Hint domain